MVGFNGCAETGLTSTSTPMCRPFPMGGWPLCAYEEGYVVDENGVSSWSAKKEQVLALLPS